MNGQRRRMRIYRGRVMHLVEDAPGGWIRSVCRRKHPVKGVHGTEPRAESYPEYWTENNLLEYPNCRHCPPDDAGAAT